MRHLFAACLCVALAAPVGAATFHARARSFRCLLQGQKPTGKNFFVFHRSRKRLGQAVAIAEGNLPGHEYPVGTVIQLFPFEAMAKRGGRFNPDGHGWEFFRLGVTDKNRTEILARGAAEVANAFGSCQACHSTGDAPAFDLVCEGHGATSLPLSAAQIQAIQLGDPRCMRAH